MAINDDIYSRTLRHRALLTMYEKRLESEMNKLLVSHNIRVRKLIGNSNLNNLTALKIKLNKEIRQTYKKIYKEGISELNKLAGVSAVFHKNTLANALRNIYKARGLPEGIKVTDLIIKANGNFGQQVTAISIQENRQINRIIKNGIRDGLDNGKIITNIKRTGTAIASNQIRTLVRTGITEVSSFIAKETYRLNEDVVKGFQYVATLDSRTSLICARLDGKIYSLDNDTSPKPPQHFNCRSTTIPVVKSAKQLENTSNNRISKRKLKRMSEGRRASINGQVPARTTYSEWLSTQGNEVKLTLLGSQERVNLFNTGKLKLTQFSNKEGKLLSIDKLRELSEQ